MDAILETLAAVGIFVAGLAARAGIVLAVMLVLLVPVLLLAGSVRGFQALRRRAQGYRPAGTLRFRDGLRYAPGHTWIRPEGETLRVGLDDLSQRLLAWAVAVELPRPGQRVKEGEPIAAVSSGGRAARVASPVSGTIVAVNAAVAREPTLVKSQGYGRGWLFQVAPADGAWRSLPGGETARGWLQAEGERLSRFFEQTLGYASADGGELVGPPSSLLGDDQWKALTRAFLRT